MTRTNRASALSGVASLAATFLPVCWPLLATAQSDAGSRTLDRTQSVNDHGVGMPTECTRHIEKDNDYSKESARQKGLSCGARMDIARAIRSLASAKFCDRQAAHQLLVTAGNCSIDALEVAAKTGQLEVKTRCLTILAEIEKDKSGADALAALQRLATDSNGRVARHASKLVSALRTTNADIAIASRTPLQEPIGIQRPNRMTNQINFSVDPKTGNKNAHLWTRPTVAIVKQLKQEPNLETVFLSRGQAKDEDLVLLADIPMKGLVIDSLDVTDRGIKSLEDHPTLECLGLWSSSITDGSLESIAQIQSLTKLTIQKAPLTDDGVRSLIERLSAIGKLKTLGVFECPAITNVGLRNIKRITTLERLLLNNNGGLTSQLLKEIAHLKGLRRLDFDSIALNEADLVHLVALQKLETLSMCSRSESKLTDRGLAYVSQLTSLESLTINDAKVTDKAVSDLIQLNGLQSLGLARSEITDQGVARLAAGLPNLLQLDLSGTKVTDSGIVHVRQLTQLERLSLDDTRTGDEGLRQLEHLNHLQCLSLDSSIVSDQARQRFQQTHPNTLIFPIKPSG